MGGPPDGDGAGVGASRRDPADGDRVPRRVRLCRDGEGFAVAFARARDAIDAAVKMQRNLAAETGPEAVRLSVRMGLYSGVASEREGVYAGPVIEPRGPHHGGRSRRPDPPRCPHRSIARRHGELVDLGEHRLKDLAGPEHVFQVRADGLPTEFPPLRSLNARRGNLPASPTTLVGRAHELAELVAARASPPPGDVDRRGWRRQDAPRPRGSC